MFGGDACTRLPWNISTEPGLPVGATMPPSSASRVIVSLSSVHSGYDVVCSSWPAASVPWLWLLGINISGPLIAMTSSRNTEIFIARGCGMPSSRAQVP